MTSWGGIAGDCGLGGFDVRAAVSFCLLVREYGWGQDGVLLNDEGFVSDVVLTREVGFACVS